MIEIDDDEFQFGAVPRNNSQRIINSVHDANGIIVLYERFPHHVLNGRVKKGNKNMRLPFI